MIWSLPDDLEKRDWDCTVHETLEIKSLDQLVIYSMGLGHSDVTVSLMVL